MKRAALHSIAILMTIAMLLTAVGVDGYMNHCACKHLVSVSLFTKADCCHSDEHHSCEMTPINSHDACALADTDGCCSSSFFSLKLEVTYLLSPVTSLVKAYWTATALTIVRLFVIPDSFPISQRFSWFIPHKAPPRSGKDLVCFIHAFKYDIS